MKLLTKQQFLAIDRPVIYQKYIPCMITELNVKCDSIGWDGEMHDWFYVDLIDAIECYGTHEYHEKLDALEKDQSLSVNHEYDTQSRDGMFDDEETYLVWQVNDVKRLVSKLEEVLDGME